MANDIHKNDNKQAIRLDDILYIVFKHRKTMIGMGVIGLLVGILISFAFYVKGLTKVEYYITASIAVTSTNENGMFSANSADPNAADIHLAEDMTDSVIYVCKTDLTLNAASEKLQLIGVTADDIRPKLSLSQYESTQIIEMTLVWDNPDEGMMILNAITDVVPDILISTLKLGDVTIVNPPKVKTSTLSFINMRMIAICTLLGLFMSAGYYLVKFFIHPTYLHSEDIVNNYNLEILGEIPGDNSYFSNKINSYSAKDFSAIQEYFAACAHVLIYKMQDTDNACVYITSSAPKEGKTSITANLAYALADMDYSVLLLDMDVRNPSLSSKFDFNKDDKHSLNAVYRGEIEIEDALVSINSNLSLLPTRLEDELLKIDNKVIDIINSVKTKYDFVIIDTAPVGQVSDSMSLNKVADCAIFVVRQDQVWMNTVTESISRLRKSGIELLGSIMNDTKGGSGEYYQSNYREFGDSPYVYVSHPKREKGFSSKHKSVKADKRTSSDERLRVAKKRQKDISEEEIVEAGSEEIIESATPIVNDDDNAIDTGKTE
ncbi:MAG: AAA family ATPase [Saccharofermentans sp.]|nr:AAA family ATPase [Saccharofermentans sp.]